MVVTYVNDRNQKRKISDDVTAYVLPFSGNIMLSDIVSPFAYVNGDAVKVENGKVSIEIQEKSLEIEADETRYNICVLCSAWSPTLLLDYNSFGRTVENNTINEGVDQQILFSAIEDEDSELLTVFAVIAPYPDLLYRILLLV